MYMHVGGNYQCLGLDMNGKKDFQKGSGATAKEKECLYACE